MINPDKSAVYVLRAGLKDIANFLAGRSGFVAVVTALCGIALIAAFQMRADAPMISGNLVPILTHCVVIVALFLVLELRQEVRARLAGATSLGRDFPLGFFDTMTGLPTQMVFQDRLSAALSEGQKGKVLVIGLEQFGRVNDRRQKSFADAVVKELGHRLRTFADQADGFAARLGDDHFALYLPKMRPSELEACCQDLVERCQAPVTKGGEVLSPSVALGAVALGDVDHLRALGYDAVMGVCNFAMTTARKSNGQSFRIYDKALERQYIDLDAMAAELPRALRSGALEVFLQPRVALADESVTGFEALVRWNRNGTYVPAGDLVALAEDMGLIFDLDNYMIDKAIHAMADWNRRRKTSFPVSVNLSALHLGRDVGVAFIAECLARHQLPPELLTIEITESANLEKWQKFDGLSGLRDIGCRIAIDDFGTGYSSLARLRTLPANEIKIDRLLVAEIVDSDEARIILDAVLGLAENLEMDVVAEGIETEAQHQLLLQMGCHFGQGFAFGKPRPATDWLADATYGPASASPACLARNIALPKAAS